MDNKYIYVVITRTQTRFARFIRWVGRMEYSHSSIGLDEDLKELYAFARPQHHSIFLGHLVHETLDRYTLNKDRSVPSMVFKLPVSQKDYDELQKMIYQISHDPEYMYNLFSVLTYPVTRGFATYKSFNCTEFVAYILKKFHYPLNEPAYRYRPDDLKEILHEYKIFEGDLREFMRCKNTDDRYFQALSFPMKCRNFFALLKIIGRTYFT